jgi:hypothetical protein
VRSRLLASRRQRGELRCPRHGARPLKWKSLGGGTHELTCAACGRAVARRHYCPNCDSLKDARKCRVCEAALEVAMPAAAALVGGAALLFASEDPAVLACGGCDGLCCRHHREAGGLVRIEGDD